MLKLPEIALPSPLKAALSIATRIIACECYVDLGLTALYYLESGRWRGIPEVDIGHRLKTFLCFEQFFMLQTSLANLVRS